jgi:hypothetical protein
MSANPNQFSTAARVSERHLGVSDHASILIDLFARLRAVLEEETAAVLARDFAQIEALTESKQRLTAAYGHEVQILREAQERGDGLEPRLAARVRAAAHGFMSALEINTRTLSGSKTAHEKVIKSISDAVTAKARPASGYSRTGAYGADAPSANKSTVPIALNESV